MTDKRIFRLCVFSSSSNKLDEIYYKDAKELGKLMGENNIDLVYGGGDIGCMYANASMVKKYGGKVIGIMPEKIKALGIENGNCDEFYLTKDMRSRKAMLDEMSDGVVALAGGFGTLEELTEMIVQRQLGFTKKPVIILNTNNFYNHLIEFFEEIEKQNFARNTGVEFAGKRDDDIYYVAKTPNDVIEYLKKFMV